MQKDDVLLDKVWRQIEKQCEEDGTFPMMYSRDNSGCENYDDQEYVVMRNRSEILSVGLVEGWKVTLLEMDEWPDELLEQLAA
jgi:hypothetical protein